MAELGKDVFVAPTATVVGDVTVGMQSSIWFGAVLRGDGDQINIGSRTNIQDVAVIHVDPGLPVNIGDNVTVGHGAIVHGATIGDFSLIGMHATILNGAKIGRYCVIGAHTLVKEGMIIPDYSVVVGVPGKIIKKLTREELPKLELNAEHYVEQAQKYLKNYY
ncbi:MAG: gamma carbonic anhydrase family protein [Candidatus Cyclobacteriaceae bacterium M3_2C_046]